MQFKTERTHSFQDRIKARRALAGEGFVQTLPRKTGIAGHLAHSLRPRRGSAVFTSRIVQFFNSGALHCEAGTEDGFAPGAGEVECTPHSSDYNPQDWKINISELVRAIQVFNIGGYTLCDTGEDGFCLQ